MIGKTNAGGIVGFINVTCQNESTVTVTNGNISITQIGTVLSFKLPRTGTWTITAMSNGKTQTQTVEITPGMTANVNIRYDFYLYNRGTYDDLFQHGWSSGEQANKVEVSGRHPAAPGNSISTGSFDVTQFNSVVVEVSGVNGDARYGTSIVYAAITDTNGTILKEHSGGSQTFSVTSWTLDVSDINKPIKVRIRTAHWTGGGSESGCYASITLHSIRVISR